MKKLIFALFLLLATRAEASVCVSFFAAQAFDKKQCTEALKVYENVQTPCMAILWKTFTLKQNNLCAQTFFNKFNKKPHVLEIHFSNEAGRRNRRLSSYEFLPALSTVKYNSNLERRHRGTLKSIKRNAIEIMDFISINANQNSTVILSTGLEDNFSAQAYRVLIAEIKKNISNKILTVRNPVGKHERDYTSADFIELHGVQPHIKPESKSRCILNLDGVTIDFNDRRSDKSRIKISDVPSYIKRGQDHGCIVFLWWKEPQGIGAEFLSPRSRNFRIHPKQINLINNLIRRFEK